MRRRLSHCSSSVSQGKSTRHPFFPDRLYRSSSARKEKKLSPKNKLESVYQAWLASRQVARLKGEHLAPGTQRPLTSANVKLAGVIVKECAYDLFVLLWALHPIRTTLMMGLNIVRSLFPAFRGYSQALIIDELQTLVASGSFTWDRLLWLFTTEILRRIVESALDSFAVANESIVTSAAKFAMEYRQMEQRVRLDLPTLADPNVRDLLQESDLFVRSFSGMGGFGLLSPLDFVHIFALLTEVLSHLWVIFSLTSGAVHLGALLISIFSAAFPLVLTWLGFCEVNLDSEHSVQEARDAQRQEKLRSLAYSETHRPEIILFGLGPWILRSWARARKAVLRSERNPSLGRSTLWLSIISQVNIADLTFALQNIPIILILQSSSASLGSLTLYRGSIQSVIFSARNLVTTTRMAFQGIFLLGAFCAAMKVEPVLEPKKEDVATYRSLPGGMKIEARNLCYTYPGSKEPALRDVNFKLQAGETLAIVGYNGSGKSTLAKILLRILDFESGDLLVNNVDIRRYNPSEYHSRLTSVFQGFSKFNGTVKENIGIGYVQKLGSRKAVEDAIHLAGADPIVESLPLGLRTKLDSHGFDYAPFAAAGEMSAQVHHGLSGGEWQRIAISRAFMRANRPEVDLLLLDEPTSSLDAHAQNEIFETINKISKNSSGGPSKTVIFITHRLSTARRADKIAMMENGTVSEFGSHQELLRRNGSYAALYNASV